LIQNNWGGGVDYDVVLKEASVHAVSVFRENDKTNVAKSIFRENVAHCGRKQ
jgi:hypothetical protein